MATPTHRRTLTAHLREWDVAQVARLLVRRPDLAQPTPPSDRDQLAQRAQQQPSVVAAIASLTLAENRLLQLIVCCRPAVPTIELAAALPDGVALADIEEVFASLEDAALVWRHDGRVHTSGTLRQSMPTTLGPPVQVLLRDQTVDYLRNAVAVLRTTAAATTDPALALSLPPPATGPDGRPPRKAELTEELESLLVAPGLVDAVLARASDEAVGMSEAMASGHPLIAVDYPLSYSRHSTYYTKWPAYWLFERALLLPAGDGRAAQPREVGVVLRGGRPVSDLAVEAPAQVTGAVDQGSVDAAAADRAVRTVDRLTDLLDAWAASPVKTLKSGGLGATVLKQAAELLGTDVTEAARLIELANLAGMVDVNVVTRGTGRNMTYEAEVTANADARAWSARSVPRRWAQLAGAWLRSEHWPSATGRKVAGGKSTPVLRYLHAPSAHERRRDVLDLLASMAPGEATTPAALAGVVYWNRPQPWLGLAVESPPTVIGWVHDEAELLGMVASGSLSTFGRALAGGDPAGAERALVGALPERVRTFTLQADLTATAMGALDRDVLVELRLLADQESEGAATTYRFSYPSLRRAFDAGRDADGILAFLEEHAAKGVPGPLAYLVADVARRHGHLQVGGAGSFVVSEDPAVLADACSHRRLRKLDLRLLAPTVAVSPQPAVKVIEGLREAGFLPTGEPGEAGAAASPSVSVSGGRVGRTPASPAGDLPERFRYRTGLRSSAAKPLSEGSATKLAVAIVAGARVEVPPLRLVPEPSPYEAALDDPLEEVLELAFRETRVLAISLGDPDTGELADPIILTVAYWEPGRIVGSDVTDGQTISILSEHIGTVVDLGPLVDVDMRALGGPTGPARRTPNSRRKRR